MRQLRAAPFVPAEPHCSSSRRRSALALRIDPEFFRTVAVGAVGAIRRPLDLRRHCLTRGTRELKAKRIIDPSDRSNRLGDERTTIDVPETPFCLSSGDSCSVDLPATLSDEREDLSGEVTLQGSNGVEFGMPFGYPTSNIVLGSLVGP